MRVAVACLVEAHQAKQALHVSSVCGLYSHSSHNASFQSPQNSHTTTTMNTTSRLFLLALSLLQQLATAQTYLPLSYTIPYHQEECLYERIATPGEHLTSSVFVVSGEELRAAVLIEGPVAPADFDLQNEHLGGGTELQKFLERYAKEGMKMFASGEHGDIMQNVRPVRFTEMLDFEAEEEVYDDAVAEQELPPLHAGGGGRNGHTEEKAVAADDYERRREQKLKRQVEEEVEFDDDFVKLQMERRNKRGGAGGRERQQRRRLQEQATLMAGEPYQKTIEVQSPGW